MPTLLLIRHGHNEYLKRRRFAGRLPGVHLSTSGQEQAQRLAGDLAPLPITAIFSSPLERALETAQPLATAKGLVIKTDPGLNEIDVGKWTGRRIDGLRSTRKWKVLQHTPSCMTFPDGESICQAQERIVRALDEICKHHRAKEMIAIFFHADPIKLAVAHFVGLPLDHYQRLTINPCSVTILKIRSDSAILLGLNLKSPVCLIDN